jgi:hypothetical protein
MPAGAAMADQPTGPVPARRGESITDAGGILATFGVGGLLRSGLVDRSDRSGPRAEIFPTTFEKDLTMKRNLIAVAVAVLGFAANAAIAEPTLQMSADEVIRLNAPEATSYQADTRADEQAPFTWNP